MKKLSRRTLHALLCLLFAGLCALCVVLTDYAESKYALRTDLSFNSISTQSEATKNVLRALKEPVHIYAVFSDGKDDRQLIELLNRYQAETDMLTWSQENLTRNPLLGEIVSDHPDDSAVGSDCLIIRNTLTGRTRVLSGKNYVQYGYSLEQGVYEITGWTYEKSITEAVLYVTADELPVLQVLTGHDELSKEDTYVMADKLTSANYSLVYVDLLRGDTLSPAAPLLILSPRRDLMDSELAAVKDFTRAGGSLFITVDYNDPDAAQLPNFMALYREYGFEVLDGIVLADEKDASSYYMSTANLLPDMNYSEVTGVMKASGFEQIIVPGARGFKMPESERRDLMLEVCLQSKNSAYIRHIGENEEATLAKQPGDPEGVFALALCADRAFSDGMRSRAFIMGNSAMFMDASGQMFAYTYSGELLLSAMQYVHGGETIDLSIVPREVMREPLWFDSAAAPVLLLTLAPLIVAVLALAVLRPRKHL